MEGPLGSVGAVVSGGTDSVGDTICVGSVLSRVGSVGASVGAVVGSEPVGAVERTGLSASAGLDTRTEEASITNTSKNMTIILIKQAISLIHKYLDRINENFAKEGGFREKMTHVRLNVRNKT